MSALKDSDNFALVGCSLDFSPGINAGGDIASYEFHTPECHWWNYFQNRAIFGKPIGKEPIDYRQCYLHSHTHTGYSKLPTGHCTTSSI